MENKKVVYIISSCLDGEPEITNATLSKEKAKEILEDAITDGVEAMVVDGTEEIEEFGYDEEEVVTREQIKKFVNDMVDGKTENHYSDEFPGCAVWCDILTLE